MWIFGCVSVVAVLYAVTQKIGLIAILLYYAECGIELPDNNAIQKYTTKAVKKLLHIPS